MKTQQLTLTDSEKKITALMALETITINDLDNLDLAERQYLGVVCTKMLQNLRDTERDDFLNKIEPIMPESNKQQVWEYNHQAITSAIATLTEQHGSMPTKNQLAEETGLSRQTISKHLKEYQTHPAHAEQIEQFKIMAPRLMAKVFQSATKGDIRAAKLYLEAVGATHKQQSNTVVKSQNNHIQINNTILSQENLKRLSAEQLNQIEHIVAKALPEGKMIG
jgi:predicted transcriptional regulator